MVPGWHQNKEHWNTIILDGTIPEDEIKRMIAEVMIWLQIVLRNVFISRKKIPKGKVTTYGQVAEMAGNKKMARAVGNALHKIEPGVIPCHRVADSKGNLADEFAFGVGCAGKIARRRCFSSRWPCGPECFGCSMQQKEFKMYRNKDT